LTHRLSGAHNRTEADQRNVFPCAGVFLSADFFAGNRLPFPRKKYVKIDDKYCLMKFINVKLSI